MTSIDIRYFAKSAIEDSNLDHNDYAYYSGWSRNMKLGQQYKVGATEARELVYEINQDGWFKDPMLPNAPAMDLRGSILTELQKISTPEAARKMPKGSLRLTRTAADILNKFARQLDVDVKFSSHTQRPLHPVG